MFVVAAAEALPRDLCGGVNELTIQFPWASLLRGTLAFDPAAAVGIAGLLAPGGWLTAIVATAARDRLMGIPAADELLDGAGPDLRRRWNRYGLELTDIRAATAGEIAASGSSWAKRLLATGVRDRRAVRLTLRRA